ncbi:MAG: choice-of-anchor D domain-containing protein, partial [Anaerolineales bacterium]|nr:choice-of-anchor D domain-containing protein [Anaerolineales bacterium]
PVTLLNITGGPLQISSIATTAHFSQSNNCPATLSTGASCTIDVSFTPSQPGPQAGTLTVSHDAGAPYTVQLYGGFNKLFLPIVTRR